jgi:alcohol-forming fatty acyl-CoA reductase
VNLSRAVAAKRPGFAVCKGGHAHGRSVTALSLWKRGNASVACRMHERLSSSGGSRPSFSMHGKNSGAGSASSDHSDGIGIAQFLGGKNFLITGGTGFLAKGIDSFSLYLLWIN